MYASIENSKLQPSLILTQLQGVLFFFFFYFCVTIFPFTYGICTCHEIGELAIKSTLFYHPTIYLGQPYSGHHSLNFGHTISSTQEVIPRLLITAARVPTHRSDNPCGVYAETYKKKNLIVFYNSTLVYN